jgi:hypothetical protein
MADYYPLIARAVAALEKNTGEARRGLYERARAALVAQLKGSDPPLDDGEITRERLALEEAIRKVEAEAARRARQEPAAPPPAPPAAPAAPGPQRPAPSRPAAGPPPRPATPPAPRPGPGAPGQKPVMGPHHPSGSPSLPPSSAPRYDPRRPPSPPPQGQQRPPLPPPQPPAPRVPGRQPPSPETIDNLRADLGMSPRQPAPTRDDPFADLPPAHDFDRADAGADARAVREALRGRRQQGPDADLGPLSEEGDPALAPPPRSRGLGRAVNTEQEFLGPRPLYVRLIKPVIGALLLLALVGFGYWQSDTIVGLYQALRGSSGPAVQQSAEKPAQPATQPKISDRIGQPSQEAGPSVAQRVVLYEEEPADPQGKRFVGSAIWRTETVSAGEGKPPELAVRADVEIPERRMTMKFTIRRNTDPTLPASHTIEIMFDLPSDFSGGGIANVPGILMKQSEQTRGVPLSGLAVKVMPGFFLIGLSAVEADVQRNIQLLKERGWFDIPVVYNNNRRAILALEKGTPGERAFAEAFAAWKQ